MIIKLLITFIVVLFHAYGYSQSCVADYDNDGDVDALDAIALKQEYGRTDCPRDVSFAWDENIEDKISVSLGQILGVGQ